MRLLMHYYQDGAHTFCAWEGDLPFSHLDNLPPEGPITFLFRRPPLKGRDCFAVTHPSLLTDQEGVETLDTRRLPTQAIPTELESAISQGRVGAVNLAHPRWQEMLAPLLPPGKKRLHLLALGMWAAPCSPVCAFLAAMCCPPSVSVMYGRR